MCDYVLNTRLNIKYELETKRKRKEIKNKK